VAILYHISCLAKGINIKAVLSEFSLIREGFPKSVFSPPKKKRWGHATWPPSADLVWATIIYKAHIILNVHLIDQF